MLRHARQFLFVQRVFSNGLTLVAVDYVTPLKVRQMRTALSTIGRMESQAIRNGLTGALADATRCGPLIQWMAWFQLDE